MTLLATLARTNTLLRPLLAVVLSSLLAVVGLSQGRALAPAEAGRAASAATAIAPLHAGQNSKPRGWRQALAQISTWRTRPGVGRKSGQAVAELAGGPEGERDLLPPGPIAGRLFARLQGAPGPLPTRRARPAAPGHPCRAPPTVA